MPSMWPKDLELKEVFLRVEESRCRVCGSALIIRKDRIHCIYSLEGPLKLVCKRCCSKRSCEARNTLLSPKVERTLAMPRWRIGWDGMLWMGFRRFKRHWSVSQIQGELWDSYAIPLSEQTIADYLRKYQGMVAASHQDLAS